MKRILIILMTLALSLFLFVGCSATPNTSSGGEANHEQCESTEELPDEEKTEGGGAEEEQQPEDGKTENDDIQKEITTMYVMINGNKLEVTLTKNSSVDALVDILRQGDIIYTADDYGGFEKVGNIGHTLPRNDTQINTEAGDVILYQGTQLCLYYGNNSWSFTRIGKINGYSTNELRTLLGAGNGSTEVRLSLK